VGAFADLVFGLGEVDDPLAAAVAGQIELVGGLDLLDRKSVV
jgi:hypothetical protein